MDPSIHLPTNRLILRSVTLEDAHAVASSWKLDEGPIPLQESREKIAWMLHNHEQNAPRKIVHLCLAIVDKDTLEFMGWCGLDHRDQTKNHPVMFYMVKEKYRGKGRATEAARALIDYAFDTLRLERIDSATDFDNIASKRVMEKIGMRYLGLDEEGGHSFTISRNEYLQVKKG